MPTERPAEQLQERSVVLGGRGGGRGRQMRAGLKHVGVACSAGASAIGGVAEWWAWPMRGVA